MKQFRSFCKRCNREQTGTFDGELLSFYDTLFDRVIFFYEQKPIMIQICDNPAKERILRDFLKEDINIPGPISLCPSCLEELDWEQHEVIDDNN